MDRSSRFLALASVALVLGTLTLTNGRRSYGDGNDQSGVQVIFSAQNVALPGGNSFATTTTIGTIDVRNYRHIRIAATPRATSTANASEIYAFVTHGNVNAQLINGGNGGISFISLAGSPPFFTQQSTVTFDYPGDTISLQGIGFGDPGTTAFVDVVVYGSQ